MSFIRPLIRTQVLEENKKTGLTNDQNPGKGKVTWLHKMISGNVKKKKSRIFELQVTA